MSVRETLRDRPWIGLSLSIAAFLIAVATAWSAIRPSAPMKPRMPSEVYFSDDDGKTFFADDNSLIPPFDHRGKHAYQAAVFRCGVGAPFVGYLIGFDDAGKAALEAIPQAERLSSATKIMEIRQSNSRIKRPGDVKWVPLGSGAPLNQILVPPCTDGSSDKSPEQVLP